MKTTKIAVAIIIFILIEFAAYIYLESLHKVGINHFLSEKTKELQTKQKAVQNTYILMIENILHQEINKPEILRIFSQAQFADSLTKIILRDSLYKKLLPVYSFLRTSHINQLHFHLPNNASFLRFHRPETYGDDLTNIRYSIKMTNLNKKSYRGFEAGRAYIGFRNIFPLFYDNLHIGSVEISFSFENIKNQLRQHEDVFYGLLIKKDVLNKKVFANEKKKYALSTISEEYMYEKKYIPYENDRLNLIDQDVQTKINTYFAKNENFTVFKRINDDYYLISFISVNNIQGLPVAYIFSYKKDITIAKYQDNNSRTHIIAAILIALIAFFMVIALLKNDKVREIYNDYRDILDANLDIIFMVNVFGKQLYFNKQIKNLLGYDRDEVTGKMFTNFIPTSEIPKYLEKLKEVFLHKEIAPFETLSLHKDGRLIPVEITGKVMKYNGEIVGVGTIKDISERKKAEKKLDYQKKEYLAVNEELRQNIEVLSISKKQIESQYKYIEESEAEYRALINSTTEGYWLVDTKDITSDVNNSICEMLGYTRKEMLGRNLYEFLDDKNKKRLNVSIIQHREKNIKQYEVAFQSKSGKNIPVIINAASLFDREGNKTKSFAFITNISTRKKEEQKLLESREHLKKAQEVGKIGSWEWDIKKNEILWSDMTFKIFGIEQESNIITTEQYFRTIHSEDKQRLIANLDKAVKNKQKNLKTEYRILKGNEIIWISESSEIITDKNGVLVKMIGILQDITEQQKAEQKIRQLSTVVEQSPSTIVITDTTGAIEYVNSAFTKSTGYSFDEAKGKNPRILKSKKTKSKYYEILWETITKGETWFGEFLNIKKNGVKYWEQAVISPIKNGENVIVNYLAIKYDITDRKIAERELKKAKKDAEIANHLKSEFLANMSHEIRTPMNAIIGFSNILQKRIDNEENRSFIDKIAKSGDNLLNLINDILDLSKIEAGQLKIQKRACNPHEVFNEIPLIFTELSKQKQIPVNVTINENLPKSLIIDALRIRQVLLNLVSNALKFTKKGSISIIVTVNKTSQNLKTLELSIEVKDTGIGIPANQIDIIFKSFRQVEGQSTKKYGGTGLGLAISKRLVELMGGTITVKSTTNVGSTFTILLKNVHFLDLEHEKIIDDDEISTITFSKSKILHVEDIEYNREIISIYLEEDNIEIKEAETGHEALEILKNYTPNLILMDIQLPKLNGYETTKIIRKNKRLKSIPIIAITANATKEEIEKYSHVFDDYITKPVDENLLLKTIKKYLKYKEEKNNVKKAIIIAPCISELKQEKTFSEELKKHIKEDLEPLHKELLEILNLDKLQIFISEIKNLGERYKISGFQKYSIELQASINNFNLDKINKLLNYFNEINQIIEK